MNILLKLQKIMESANYSSLNPNIFLILIQLKECFAITGAEAALVVRCGYGHL